MLASLVLHPLVAASPAVPVFVLCSSTSTCSALAAAAVAMFAALRDNLNGAISPDAAANVAASVAATISSVTSEGSAFVRAAAAAAAAMAAGSDEDATRAAAAIAAAAAGVGASEADAAAAAAVMRLQQHVEQLSRSTVQRGGRSGLPPGRDPTGLPRWPCPGTIGGTPNRMPRIGGNVPTTAPPLPPDGASAEGRAIVSSEPGMTPGPHPSVPWEKMRELWEKAHKFPDGDDRQIFYLHYMERLIRDACGLPSTAVFYNKSALAPPVPPPPTPTPTPPLESAHRLGVRFARGDSRRQPEEREERGGGGGGEGEGYGRDDRLKGDWRDCSLGKKGCRVGSNRGAGALGAGAIGAGALGAGALGAAAAGVSLASASLCGLAFYRGRALDAMRAAARRNGRRGVGATPGLGECAIADSRTQNVMSA